MPLNFEYFNERYIIYGNYHEIVKKMYVKYSFS